jgi:transaldolase
MIAQQKGVALEDLALKSATQEQKDSVNQESLTTPPKVVEPVQAPTDGVLTDDMLAAQLRSQADAMFKEAKRLREEAEKLMPTKKTTSKKTPESAE